MPDNEPAAPRGRAPVIGLLGGIGSGKSALAACLRDLGARVLDADRHARQALALPEIVAQLPDLFGPGVLAADGSVDRTALAARVFAAGQEEALARLEGLLHPLVRAGLRAELDEESARERPRPCVLDVPLLLEGETATWCDALVFVEVREEVREARCRARGWEPGERARRESRQVSLAEKRERATRVVANDGSLEELARQATELWEWMTTRSRGRRPAS